MRVFDRARVYAGACALGIGIAAACDVACGGLASRSGAGSRSTLFSPEPARALAASEKAVLDREGLVLVGTTTSPEQSTSFHLGYTAIFHAHQPVYITADTLLYAWHASYDQVLADLEEAAMAPTLIALIDELRASLARAPVDRPGRAELDLLLTVAARLATGEPAAPLAGADDAAIASIVSQAERADGIGKIPLGVGLEFDYSMLKPRGHYTHSVALQRYFRASSWLGRVELRIANPDVSGTLKLDRKMLAAVALLRALSTPKSDALWRTLDTTAEAIAGPRDSMSFQGIDAAMATLHVLEPLEIQRATDTEILAAFSRFAGQRINTQLVVVQHGAPLPPSLAFVLLGPRYVFDAHVLGDVTYGRLKEKRMMPSPLDVAATAFANDRARALLAPEITRFGGGYRDALDALTALRRRPAPELWKGSVYHLWLSALTELSPDGERDAKLPEPFTKEAWSRRMLSTQLASWAELRHDNLLYAKQSVTGIPGCEYPDAYVEPYPRFFATLEEMATKGKSLVDLVPLAGAKSAPLKARISGWFDHFARVSGRLRQMAERERRNEPLTEDDLDFLNRMVRVQGKNVVCAIVAEPEGWHADLYYDKDSALYHRPVVADVHTQPADEQGAIVGKVLHVGTANPRMLVVTLRHDGGAHAATYRGFVSSYAEVTTEKFQRMTDEDWRVRIAKERPKPPPWLESLVVE